MSKKKRDKRVQKFRRHAKRMIIDRDMLHALVAEIELEHPLEISWDAQDFPELEDADAAHGFDTEGHKIAMYASKMSFLGSEHATKTLLHEIAHCVQQEFIGTLKFPDYYMEHEQLFEDDADEFAAFMFERYPRLVQCMKDNQV